MNKSILSVDQDIFCEKLPKFSLKTMQAQVPRISLCSPVYYCENQKQLKYLQRG